MESRNIYIIVAIVSFILSFGIGFIIGHFTVETTSKSDKEILQYYKSLVEDSNNGGLNELIKTIDVENIKKKL